jgi:2-polyprenyl-3-methyl-5-hydroxy-6-metoxy-1,4-benzoquinol methylase
LLKRYGALGLGAAAYARARLALGHYTVFERRIPREGPILDFGCGVGQLGLFLKLVSGKREVHGYDHSSRRIETARRATEGLDGICFHDCATSIPAGPWKAVVFFDMLHYVSDSEQDEIVAAYAKNVDRGGLIVIRDVFAGTGFRFHISYLHERVMVGARFTPTSSAGLHFRRIDDARKLGARLGLKTEIFPPPRFHPYADYLVVCEKQ